MNKTFVFTLIFILAVWIGLSFYLTGNRSAKEKAPGKLIELDLLVTPSPEYISSSEAEITLSPTPTIESTSSSFILSAPSAPALRY